MGSNPGLFRGRTADMVRAAGRAPTPTELRAMALESKAPEDYERWQGPEGDKMLQTWLNRGWDVGAGGFRTTKTDMGGNRIQSNELVYKPDDVPEGWIAYGPNGTAIQTSQLPQQQQPQGNPGISLGQLGGVTPMGAAQPEGMNPAMGNPMSGGGQVAQGWNDWRNYGL